MRDMIYRQAALDIRFSNGINEDGILYVPYREMVRGLKELPSAQPYTEAEIQKMQDLEQAQIQKAYELGKASAQPEWNNHTVACLLADLFDDTCACNYNGIDEWLPEKCEVIDSCPNPVGVACWEQFLKHRAERRTDDSISD